MVGVSSLGLTLVRQPPGSKLCGHACVAMICGVSLADAVTVIGHQRSTWLYELRRAVDTISKGSMLLRSHQCEPCTPALVKLKHPTARACHWAILDGRVILDPENTDVAVNHWYVLTYAPIERLDKLSIVLT